MAALIAVGLAIVAGVEGANKSRKTGEVTGVQVAKAPGGFAVAGGATFGIAWLFWTILLG